MIHASVSTPLPPRIRCVRTQKATRGNIDVVLTVNGTARRGRGQPSRPADTARALRRLVPELTTLATAATAIKRVTADRRPAGVIALAAPAA